MQDLVDRGVEVSGVFHDTGGVFHHAGTEARARGPAPEHKSYGSFASFSDPDGNGWLFQEVTARLAGRVEGAQLRTQGLGHAAGGKRRRRGLRSSCCTHWPSLPR